ncbi:MAG: hypothetical protein ACTTKY_00405 [Catonella sp.]
MVEFLHTFIFDAKKPPDSCFKTIIDGKISSDIPTVHAGETARGIRVILSNFKYEETIECYAYFKVAGNDKILRVPPHNRKKNMFDFYFPTMNAGKYECEIVASQGKKIISSGVFQGRCLRAIRSVFFDEVTTTDTSESIINAYDKYSKLLKEEIDKLKNLNLGTLNEDIHNIKTQFEELKKHPGDKTYIYTQDVASDIWEITHNLNKHPSITIVDTGNNTVHGDCEYIDKNKLVIKFSFPFSGKAFLN